MLAIFRKLGLGKLAIFVVLGISFACGGAKAHAATYEASLTTSGSVSFSVTPEDTGASIGVDEVVVNSTCPAGYTLLIAGPSDTTLYKDGDSTSTEQITASAGTAENPLPIIGAEYLNTWGYSVDSSEVGGDFVGVNSALVEIAAKAAASAAGGDTVEVHYGASVSVERAPGAYTMAGGAAINYYLLASPDCATYQVEFNANGGTGTMANQTIVEGVETELNQNEFRAPTGMRFAEWNTAADGTGTSYADGASVTDLASVGQTVTLYAQWVTADRTLLEVLDDAYYDGELTDDDKVGSYYKMQSVTHAMCDAVAITGEGSQTQLIDARDSSVYWVTKLDDGHCWMTQNLDLDLTSDVDAAGYVALTSENTDLQEYGAHGYDSLNGYSCSNADSGDCASEGEVITWVPERGTIAPGELNLDTWSESQSAFDPYSYDPGPNDIVDTDMPASAGEHRLAGNYYSWAAAIASNDSISFSTDTVENISNNPKNSICPKGWRLPTISTMSGDTAGSTNEFARLNAIYNGGLTTGDGSGAMLGAAPLYFAKSNIVSGNEVKDLSSGAYWSSTSSWYNTAHAMQFELNGVDLGDGDGEPFFRGQGFSVRCLMR